MKTFAFLTVGFTLCGGLGCVHLQPVGPMAKTLGYEEPRKKSVNGVTVTAAKDASMGLRLPTAPPPVPPASLVTPGEVSDANSEQAKRRLIEEMDADRKAIDKMPRYAEVSVIGKK
ncbi:MAG: hypothetical protein ACRC7O_04870 [Fimbriiglobus sp.]